MRRKASSTRGGVRALAIWAIPALVLTLSGTVTAQTKVNPQKPLEYNVTVTLKLVQAYVTGKDGRPVADLAPEEFEVSDNGQSVPVTHFERHFLGTADAAAGAPAPGPRMNRKFFLLFDFGFIDPHGTIRAKTAGLHFLDAELRPDDEVGLLTYTAYKGLVLHEYLTTDHAKIRRIVDGFGLKRVSGRAEDLQDFLYAVDLREQAPAASGQPAPADDFYQRQARLQTGQQVDGGARQGYIDRARHFVESLDNFARVLRYIPGYKNIILFSGGLARQVLYGKRGGAAPGAWTTPEELAAQLNQYDSAQGDGGLLMDYTSMLEQFKASNSPVYALDVSRAQKEADVTYHEGSSQVARELAGADSLRQFASGTGGKFYANTVDHKKIMDEIQNITGAYYVLGYSVSEKWDGKFHKIKVRVRRKGCDVMAQGGYFSPKPFKEYTSFEKLLHATDLALSDSPELQVPAELPVVAMAVTVKGAPKLAAFARATRAAHNDVLGTKSEAYLLLLDDNGEVSVIKRFKLDLPDPKQGKDTLFPSFLLDVKPGRYNCRIVLRNMDTGVGARGSAPVVIPGAAAAPLVLDTPLLLTLDPRSTDLASSEPASLSAVFAYDAGSHAPLVGPVPAGPIKLFAALRLTSSQANPEYEVTASLKEAAAAEPAAVPVSILRETREGATSLVLVELAAGELRPGQYALVVRATQKGGAQSASARVEFIVK